MAIEQILMPALVSGAVAIIVAATTAILTVRSQSMDQKKQRAQLQREMTKMLYEKRIELYPQFMQLTEPLRRSKISASAADRPYFLAALDALEDWHSGEAGFVISLQTLECYYELRKALRVEPAELNGRFSDEQIARVKVAQANFRASLRNDMRLFYHEEAGAYAD